MLKTIITSICLIAACFAASATEVGDTIIRRKGAIPLNRPTETVVVGGDTVSIVLPQKNYGRFDRGLYNYLFIPKGQWAFGLTASYSEFNADDVQLLSYLNDFDFDGKQYSIRPTVSYFVKNNQALGLKLGYTRRDGNLGRLAVDFDDDLSFDVRDVSYSSTDYSIGIFYRNYVGLGTMKRFAVFNEVDLSFASGSSRFIRSYNNIPKDTRTTMAEASLNFSPGLCVFIMDNVNFNVSFGIFGLKMRKERQTTDGVDHGSRFSSGANFRFNIFNINFGLGVNI
ncbi:MAG: hypothetical protein NC342_06470 [Pseudoflavonifractor sp.]|nr:hypothetical protein [Alloprevotella sp.]MCM1117163.1 hypothetical protein [Pseudoflavonifractor sp.]